MSSEPLRVRVCLVALTAWCLATFPRAHAEVPTTEAVAEARTHFDRGTQLARSGHCDLATSEFEAAITLAARPNAYFNLGRCAEQLHRNASAYRAFDTFLLVAETNDSHRAFVRQRLAALRQQVAALRIEADLVDAEVFVDGADVGSVPAMLVFDPSTVMVEIRHPSSETTARSFTLEAGATITWVVALTPLAPPAPPEASQVTVALAPEAIDVGAAERPATPPPRGRHRISRGPFIGGLSSTGAALLFGASFGIRALRERAAGEHLDPFDADAREHARAQIRAHSQVADAGFATALGLAIATTLVGVFTDFDATDDDARHPSVALVPLVGMPSVGPHARADLGVALVGRFR